MDWHWELSRYFQSFYKDFIFCYLHSHCHFKIHHGVHVVNLLHVFFSAHKNFKSAIFAIFIFSFSLFIHWYENILQHFSKTYFFHCPKYFCVAYKLCDLFSQYLFQKYDLLIIPQVLTQISTGHLWYSPALRTSVVHSSPHWHDHHGHKLADVIQIL